MLRVWCMNDGALWSLCQHCWTGWMRTFVKHRSAVEIHRSSRYLYLIIDQLEIKGMSCHLVLVEGFENRCDPMTRAFRSTLSPSWTPKTLLFRINSWIVVQDLTHNKMKDQCTRIGPPPWRQTRGGVLGCKSLSSIWRIIRVDTWRQSKAAPLFLMGCVDTCYRQN